MRYLKFAGIVLLMLSVVPLAGFLNTGSLRQAWQYTRTWLMVVGGIAVVSAFLFLIVWAAIPHPE